MIPHSAAYCCSQARYFRIFFLAAAHSVDGGPSRVGEFPSENVGTHPKHT